jgi:nitroimidazol reductase NimA-like FMN-containing flavoprotein (pyridoxamine 5'-phosphate oxidase superfamily)
MSRTDITRIREKGSADRAALDALLDSCILGHFGTVDEAGGPVVIPTAVVRDCDTVLAHGSTGSPWMRRLAAGAPACLTVTELEGVVVARSAFESSLHYRSAVLFGSCTVVTDAAAKDRALDLITERLIPGRNAEIRRPRKSELAATLVLALPIVEWSLKISDGWPDDPDDDVAGDAWAGVVPQKIRHGVPRAAPDLRGGIAVPPSVLRLADS